MAEHTLHHLGGERFEAHSAGSRPAGFIHPLAIAALAELGIPILFAESKSWDRYEGEQFDAVLTMCDSAAQDPCPIWPGAPLIAHWSLPDPAFHPGDDQERFAFAITVARRIVRKIEGLIQLDWSADRAALQLELNRLGDI